jgi:hypothetical protein
MNFGPLHQFPLADEETMAALNQLSKKDTEIERALMEEFGVGDWSSLRGIAGFKGDMTEADALVSAIALEKSINENFELLKTLRHGNFKSRVLSCSKRMKQHII